MVTLPNVTTPAGALLGSIGSSASGLLTSAADLERAALMNGSAVIGALATTPSQIDAIPTQGPEPLEAIRGGARFDTQLYGRTLPYVIGTGPVDGMVVYASAVTVVTTTIEDATGGTSTDGTLPPPINIDGSGGGTGDGSTGSDGMDSTDVYLAYAFRYTLDVSNSDGGDVCPYNPGYPVGTPEDWGVYTSSVTFTYDGDGSISLLRNGAWTDLALLGLTADVTKPAAPSLSFGSWLYAGGSGSSGGWMVSGGNPRFTEPSGAPLAITLPEGFPCYGVSSIAGDMWGDVFTGSPRCTQASIGPFSGGNMFAPSTGTRTIGDTSSFRGFGDFTIDRADFSATVAGKTYVPIGMSLIGGEPFGGGVGLGTFFILLKVVR